LGDDRAEAYAAALRVTLPRELSVQSLSLRNNRLTGEGTSAILKAVDEVSTREKIKPAKGF